MPKVGKQTWSFQTYPRIVATGTVAGSIESEGPLGEYFDIRHQNDRADSNTWEHAEQKFVDEAARRALEKANLTAKDIDLVVGGDLNAQLTGFYFGTRNLTASTLGVYSACASICESLAIGALTIDSGMAQRTLVGTSSHNSTAERQFRYPTEYGVQKPPSAQRTVTGAGMAVLSPTGSEIAITHATIGQVVDMGIKSPWEMGAAMAPAAFSTITTHLADTGRSLSDYDCIATGDLGRIGHEILKDLLREKGHRVPETLTDCGILIYRADQPEVFSGGSGGACATLVTFGYLLHQLTSGAWKRILVSATGALLSAVSAGQSDSIPAVSHAIAFERKDEA